VFAVAAVLFAAGLAGYAAVLLNEPEPGRTAKNDEEDDNSPAVLNPPKPPGAAPAGMVWVRGGEFYRGDENFPDAQPVRKVYVDGFWMDKTEVTNAQFAQFAKETGYVTVAERRPDPKQFPQLQPAKLLRLALEEGHFKYADYLLAGYPTAFPMMLTVAPSGGLPGAMPWGASALLHTVIEPCSLVFDPPLIPKKLRDHREWWQVVKGACWRHPEGPDSNVKRRQDHPVVHICWIDAVEYCRWKSKKEKATYRLPTEAEWEFAARGGLDRKPYVWGDDLNPDGKWVVNIWQGLFPFQNTRADGFQGTAPVASFPANGYGLHDMSGNVWEWCGDWYQPDCYEQGPRRNPKGPESSFDPHETDLPKRVQRGGSFLCADNYCVRYMVGARGKGEPTSGASHVGFRCVREAR
jgi:formylglycine-generating enzyme required for sulfatase activity